MVFKTASRSESELKDAKATLDNAFKEAVVGSNGKFNARGLKKLDDNRMDIAELIVQLIQDTVNVTDPLPFLVEQVEGDIKNQYVWQRPNSALKVTQRSYGSKPLSQRITFSEFSIKTTMKELAVEIPLEEVASGRVTPSMVTEQIAFTINRYRLASVLDALDTAITAVADRSGKAGFNLRYTGLTKANLDNAIDGLYDEGVVPSIFARYTAFSPTVRNFAGWSNLSTYDHEKRGQIASYLGAPVVQLNDQFSFTTQSHALRNDRVYIASGKPGAKFMTKDVSFLNWAMVDQRTATFGTGVRIEDGLLVWDPYQYRIIEVS